MDVTHATGWYFPDASGGTEVYVDALVGALNGFGVTTRVLAGRESDESDGGDDYSWNDTPVHRYPVRPPRDIRQVHGDAPHGGFPEFTRHLSQCGSEIFHQHAWAYGCGIHHLRFARSLGLRTVLTVHVPSPLCLRGTMLHLGKSACDGVFQRGRFADCWLEGRGAGPLTRRLIAAVPMALSRCASGMAGSRVLSALATEWLTQRHGDRLREAISLCDRVVAVCDWLYVALRANGVSDDQLVLSRQGVPPGVSSGGARPGASGHRADLPSRPTRFGFLGRADPLKGLHLLIEAWQHLPVDSAVELHVHALAATEAEWRYLAQSMERAGSDERIRFLGPLPRSAVADALASLDALVVPSQLLETGPLVILEALAAGIAVIGSDLGGIRELLVDDPHGCLVQPADVSAWACMIHRISDRRRGEPGCDEKSVQRSHALRTMSDVAAEMHTLYQQLT